MLDYDLLRNQLDELASAIEKLPNMASEVERLRSARDAAQVRDETSLRKHLRAVGAWVIDVATKIGVTVAAEAIKNAIK